MFAVPVQITQYGPDYDTIYTTQLAAMLLSTLFQVSVHGMESKYKYHDCIMTTALYAWLFFRLPDIFELQILSPASTLKYHQHLMISHQTHRDIP